MRCVALKTDTRGHEVTGIGRRDIIKAGVALGAGDANLKQNFDKGSLEAIGGSPEQLGKLARSDSEKYQRLVKELNISAG